MRRAGDPRFPYWLRVAALAYGSHTDNGHARYKRGEIALVLGKVDATMGEVLPYVNVGRAIEDAVDYGWLSEDSYWGCLVVPRLAIKKGPLGHSPGCPRHERHARAREANRSFTDGFAVHSSTPSERFAARNPHSVSGSQGKPLSLVSAPTPTPSDREVS